MSNVKVQDLPVDINPALTDRTITDKGNIVTMACTWQAIFDLFIANGVLTDSSNPSVVAAGTDQASATVLNKVNNRVITVPAGSGVVEDAASVANVTRRTVQNRCGTGEDLLYYPFSGENFFGQGPDVPLTIADGNQVTVICYTNGELSTI